MKIIPTKRRFAIFFANTLLIVILLFHKPIGGIAETSINTPIQLQNTTFKCVETDGVVDVKNWLFLERVPGCALLKPKDGAGVIMLSSSEKARADLLSSKIKMKKFKEIEVTVDYEVVIGNPLLFVCLRPSLNRKHVDLDFLPIGLVGKNMSETVKFIPDFLKETIAFLYPLPEPGSCG